MKIGVGSLIIISLISTRRSVKASWVSLCDSAKANIKSTVACSVVGVAAYNGELRSGMRGFDSVSG